MDYGSNNSTLSLTGGDNLDDIADTLLNLATTTSNNQTLISNNTTLINDVSGSLNTLDALVQDISGSLNTLDALVQDISGVVDANIIDIASNTTLINDVSGSLNTLDTQVQDISGVVDANIIFMNDVSYNLNILNIFTQDVSSQVQDLSGVVDENILAIDINNILIDDVSGSLTTLRNVVTDLSANFYTTEHGANIINVSNSLTDLSGSHYALQTVVVDLSTNFYILTGTTIPDINVFIGDLSSNHYALENVVVDLCGNVATNVADIADISGLVQTNISTLASYNNRITAAESTLSDLQDELDELDDDGAGGSIFDAIFGAGTVVSLATVASLALTAYNLAVAAGTAAATANSTNSAQALEIDALELSRQIKLVNNQFPVPVVQTNEAGIYNITSSGLIDAAVITASSTITSLSTITGNAFSSTDGYAVGGTQITPSYTNLYSTTTTISGEYVNIYGNTSVNINGNINLNGGNITGVNTLGFSGSAIEGLDTLSFKTIAGASASISNLKSVSGENFTIQANGDAIFGLKTISNLQDSAQVVALIAAAVSNLLGAADPAYNTLKELQDEIQNNDVSLNDVFTNVATKVSKSGDTMTGNLRITNAGGLNINSNTSTTNGDRAFVNLFESGNAWGHQISNDAGDAAFRITKYQSGTNYERIKIVGSADAGTIYMYGNANITGNVGIGTNTAASKLHIYQNSTDTGTSAGLTIEQGGTGDALIQYLTTGVTRWTTGIDNSDSDKFKIKSLNGGGEVSITTAGEVDIAGAVVVNDKITIGQVATVNNPVLQDLLQLRYRNTGNDTRSLTFKTPAVNTDSSPFIIDTGNSLTFQCDGGDALRINSVKNIEIPYNLNVDGVLTVPKIQMTATQNTNKICLWDSSSRYSIGMTTTGNSKFGGLYWNVMYFTMNDDNNSGFLWRDSGHASDGSEGAMSLSTDGRLTVANNTRIGYGETTTTDPTGSIMLDVSGNTNITEDLSVGGNVIFQDGSLTIKKTGFASQGLFYVSGFDTNDIVIDAYSPSNTMGIRFRTNNGTDRMIIAQTGNVTIQENLSVSGTISSPSIDEKVSKILGVGNFGGSNRIDSGFYQTSLAQNTTGFPAGVSGYFHLSANTHSNLTNYFSSQFCSSFSNQKLFFRNTNNSGNTAWNRVITGDEAGNIMVGTNRLITATETFYQRGSNFNNGGTDISFLNWSGIRDNNADGITGIVSPAKYFVHSVSFSTENDGGFSGNYIFEIVQGINGSATEVGLSRLALYTNLQVCGRYTFNSMSTDKSRIVKTFGSGFTTNTNNFITDGGIWGVRVVSAFEINTEIIFRVHLCQVE